MEYFDKLNLVRSLFLLDIEEPEDNRVVITVQETTVSDEEEYIKIGAKQIGPVKAIITNEKCTKFSLFFQSYVAYCVMNETFPLWDKQEEWTGKVLRIYSKSNYLDYIKKSTMAIEYFDYMGEKLKHFGILCENHVIHIISIDEPMISLLS